MCNVKKLDDEMRRIIVNTTDGNTYWSDWYTDNDNEKIEGNVNCTEMQFIMYNRLLIKYNLTDSDVDSWHISRKREKDNVYISNHAFDRMKERCGWNKKAALRMVEKVWEYGQDMLTIKGYLAPWIKGRIERQSDGEHSLLYGKFLYVFRENTLITVVPIPQKGRLAYKF